MPLVSLPKELFGIKWIDEQDINTGLVTRRLPDDATPEQKKAYIEYQNNCKQAQQDMAIIED